MLVKGFRQGEVTFEEFLVLLPEDQKADLLDGVVYVDGPDRPADNELAGWLVCVLGMYCEERDLGKVYMFKVAYRLNDKTGPEPDLGFVLKQHRSRETRTHVDGPPDLAIEVVSPETLERDYILKRRVYEAAGVREYWILERDQKRATFLRLREGVYAEVRPVKNRIHSEVVKGFWLDVRWLLDEDRPTPLTVLKQLLPEETESE